jgi:hypothetical protein
MTSSQPLGERYDPLGRIIVGRGRDYSDVRPLTGICDTIRAGASETLT